MALVQLWDGLCSVAAAVATAVICGLPCWFIYQAYVAGVAPQWALASIAALGGVGIILTLAFLRKGFRGISPSRDRKRY